MRRESGATRLSVCMGFWKVDCQKWAGRLGKGWSDLDLSNDIEGVGVAVVGEIDAHKCIHNIVPVTCNTIEAVVKVLPRILDSSASAQYRKACKHDEEKDNKLDRADQIHQPDGPPGAQKAYERKKSVRAYGQAFVLPLACRVAGCAVDVLRENYGIAAGEREGHCEKGVHGWEEKGGPGVRLLEVRDLSAGAIGEEGGVFEVDG
jgi:hypothetical protein